MGSGGLIWVPSSTEGVFALVKLSIFRCNRSIVSELGKSRDGPLSKGETENAILEFWVAPAYFVSAQLGESGNCT